MKFFKTSLVRDSITFLHASDGLIALSLGLSVYYQSNIAIALGILAITKFFLLHLLSRMVTGVKAYTYFEIAMQTTKTFIHHTGSFYYISNPTVAVVTGLWRFVSMNGHAILSYKSAMSTETFDKWMWAITHSRHITMAVVMLLCAVNEEVRRGFGELPYTFAAVLVVACCHCSMFSLCLCCFVCNRVLRITFA